MSTTQRDIEDVRDPIVGLYQKLDMTLNISLTHREHTTYTGKVLRSEKFFPAWLFSESHPFVEIAVKGLRSYGLDPKIGAYMFCTNDVYCTGVAGIPTVGFGPAREGDAHTVDENIKIIDIYAAAKGYRGIIETILS